MARPKNKDELLITSEANYIKLLELVNAYSLQEQKLDFSTPTLNRNIRDVLAHLHHWHLMMLEWYLVGMSGEKPKMPAKGYTWKTTPELNIKIQKSYSKVDLLKVKSLFEGSYHTVQKIILNHTNNELFEKKRYKWTGTTSLGSYLVSCTSSHYDWAFKLIKKGKK